MKSNNEKNWVVIGTYNGNVNAEMAKNILIDNNIPAYIKSDFFGSAYNLNAFNIPTGSVKLYIHEAYKKKKISIFNKGNFFRDLIFVTDVISGINIILKKGKPGELYWISSGKKTWFYNLAKILQKQTDCKINYPLTPKYTKKVDVGNFVVDNKKLKSLGWKPKVTLEDGIKKTLESF